MEHFLKFIGAILLAALLTFFSAWCIQVVYNSCIPLFTLFSVTLPQLSYGVFVLIALLISFIKHSVKIKGTKEQMDFIEGASIILTETLTSLVIIGMIALTSSIVF